MKKYKKAQHEIVGFVLIILIVSIIGLIFLSFLISNGKRINQKNAELSYFLEASMYHTSNCSFDFNHQYKNIKDLIKECYKNPISKCSNNKKVCEVLEKDFKKLIDKSFNIREDFPNKAYNLSIYYSSENLNEKILDIKNGIFENCNFVNGGSSSIAISSFSSGIINIELKVCKG